MVDRAPELEIEPAPNGVRLVGEVDAANLSKLIEALDPLPGVEGDITIDLSGVVFIDSSGLRALIDVHQRAEHRGRRVVMVRPSSVVRRLFDISGLVPHLHVVDSAG